MARSIPRNPALILCFVWPLLVAAAAPSNILVRYSFDDDVVATGPDTFAVFERAKGSVKLSANFRLSGYHSVELRDAAGDGNFPELQGYFKRRRSGRLFAHFAFLTTDANDLLNIALAGPKWFTLEKSGIGFWLKSENGFLYHVTDSIPIKLFPLRPFVWYVADVAYDIDRGEYDLTIREEGTGQPIVSLEAQKNAANQPRSAVDKFSFVTDPFTDKSNLTYYVDDVVIGTDRAVTQPPLVAPGRRKLFVDYWVDYQKRLRKNPGCVPVTGPTDIGAAADLRQMQTEGSFGTLTAALESGHRVPRPELEANSQDRSDRTKRIFQAFNAWQTGCDALGKRRGAAALAAFDEAAGYVPEGKIYGLSRLLALAALQRWPEVERELSAAYSDWQGDSRFEIVQAMLGMARPDLDRAESWIREPAEKVAGELGEEIPNLLIGRLWAGEIDRDLIAELRRTAAPDWESVLHQALLAEEYFFVLLWRGSYAEAERYAARMVERLELLASPKTKWLERAGNAAFLLGDFAGAERYYNRVLADDPAAAGVLVKLSDVSLALGDVEGERRYRERIYGSLVRPEDR